MRANALIRDITGRAYTPGYRSPAWDLSEHTLGLLAKHGFRYESSQMGDDYTPYFAREGDCIDIESKLKDGSEIRVGVGDK